MRLIAAGVLVSVVTIIAACDKKPATMSIEPATLLPFEKKGKTAQLKAQLKDDRGIFVATAHPHWESSDVSVATVSEDGLITAMGTGKTTITGTEQGISASLPVDVKLVGSVEITPNTPQKLKMGKDTKISVVVKDDRGNVLPGEKVRFKTVGYAVDVDPEGLVHGQAVGETTVVAVAQDKEARVVFTVTD